jgi:hypothetical protein
MTTTRHHRQVKTIIVAFCRAIKQPVADSSPDLEAPSGARRECGLEHIELPDSERRHPRRQRQR